MTTSLNHPGSSHNRSRKPSVNLWSAEPLHVLIQLSSFHVNQPLIPTPREIAACPQRSARRSEWKQGSRLGLRAPTPSADHQGRAGPGRGGRFFNRCGGKEGPRDRQGFPSCYTLRFPSQFQVVKALEVWEIISAITTQTVNEAKEKQSTD